SHGVGRDLRMPAQDDAEDREREAEVPDSEGESIPRDPSGLGDGLETPEEERKRAERLEERQGPGQEARSERAGGGEGRAAGRGPDTSEAELAQIEIGEERGEDRREVHGDREEDLGIDPEDREPRGQEGEALDVRPERRAHQLARVPRGKMRILRE